MKVLTYDLETRNNPADKGWKNFDAMGISFACAHLDWVDEYHLYTEDDLPLLVASMVAADVITGFNIKNFDNSLLKATLERTGVRIIDGWDVILAKCYDPFEEICRHTRQIIPRGWNLQNVTKSNLSICKNGDGAHAPALFQDQKWGRLATYILQDVKVEKELFRHCRKNRSLQNNFLPKVQYPVTVPLPLMDALCAKHGWVEEGVLVE